MNENTMTPELDAKLREIRWFPGRRVDDVQIIEWLNMGVRDFGCHIFPEAVEVLREFGDLLIKGLHFTPEGSCLRTDKLEWLRWEWEINEVLFPIAYEPSGTYTLALSSTGKVFGSGVTDIFCGNSFEEFLSHQLGLTKARTGWPESDCLNWTAEKNDDLYLIYDSILASDE